MDPIAQTAYYCCGVRAADARSARPVCGDELAHRFMDAQGAAVFRRFARFKAPNVTNAMRHRIIDDALRDRFRVDPHTPVLLLGAGFDTRAFRLGGGRWLEIDQPGVIARKEACLPAATSPQPLMRLAMDFATESLSVKLAPWRGTTGAVVVLEGVSMYLNGAQLQRMTAVLRELLPGHTLICDLMDGRFARLFSRGLLDEVRAMGGQFALPMDDPAGFVASLGYQLRSAQSVPARTIASGALSVPEWWLYMVLMPASSGYQIYVFEAQPGVSPTRGRCK